MKTLTVVGVLLAAMLGGTAPAGEGAGNDGRKLLIRDGDIIATCGDSITWQGGRWYVRYMSDYVHMCAGLRKVRFKNTAFWGRIFLERISASNFTFTRVPVHLYVAKKQLLCIPLKESAVCPGPGLLFPPIRAFGKSLRF